MLKVEKDTPIAILTQSSRNLLWAPLSNLKRMQSRRSRQIKQYVRQISASLNLFHDKGFILPSKLLLFFFLLWDK